VSAPSGRSPANLSRAVSAFVDSPAALRRTALASVIANVAIVGTGGLVRLTGSGLGCPTWPRCTDESYTTTAAMGVHGAIEFGNRLLSFVVGIIALAGLVLAYRQRHRIAGALRPAIAVLLGVGVQGVVGGITVRLALNPWTVALHFLLSIGLLAITYTFRRSTHDQPPRWTAPGPARTLGILITTVSAAVLVLGTIVTGSGPHAGDAKAARTGFDPATTAQLHTDAVLLLLGLSIAMWLALRALGAPLRVTRAGGVLILVELGQGLIGFVQYFTNLPWVAVLLHMVGACLVWLATLGVLAAVSSRRPAIEAAQRDAADHSLASTA
jgi:heme a synthase